MQLTPREELESRVGRFQERLRQEELQGAILTEKVDLFYFAGSMQQGYLFIPAEGPPLYMVRRNFSRAREESTWDQIVRLKSIKKLPSYLAEVGPQKIKKIGLELDVLPVNEYHRLEAVLAGVEFKDVSLAVKEIRMLKSSYEVDCFREAGRIAAEIMGKVPALLQIGKTELMLATEMEALYRRAGHQGVLRMRAFNTEMFFGHVYSGINGMKSSFLDSCTGGEGLTTACPQGAGRKKLAPHEPIGLDYASIYEGYTLDHTRVFSIGELPAELLEAYALARRIQEEVISRCKPGTPGEELYNLALELAGDGGLEAYFMGYGDGKVKFIGHGVGLDIDEFPILSAGSHVLQPGMVFALEPKFVFPDKGVIGLENVWHITEEGAEKLSPIADDLVTVPVK